jgi:hypothetical protein
MKSLFNAIENREVINRLNKLTSETKALWGKMSVAQMLAHSQTTIEVALGERHLKGGLIAFLFGKIAKKKLGGEAPFKHNLPTAPSFIVKDDRNFNEEKDKIINLVQRFGDTDPEEIAARPHPFFGRLTAEEWNNLQWKHLDHHLRQFGV